MRLNEERILGPEPNEVWVSFETTEEARLFVTFLEQVERDGTWDNYLDTERTFKKLRIQSDLKRLGLK